MKLVEKLSDLLLVDKVRPGSVHAAFCQLPFDFVCTTNVDFLIERGYEQAGLHYCRPVIDEEQLAAGLRSNIVTLLKLHGDLHHPGRLVFTEQDYDAFIQRYSLMATFLANMLIVRTPLFIGYSLDDPDFRQIWQVIHDRLGKLRRFGYTIAVSPSAHDINRFERRGVKIISLPGRRSDYPRILEAVFTELREYWLRQTVQKSTVTEEDSRAELSLPKEATGRLCFFSVPYDVLAFYRSDVFPIAEEFGFSPVMVEDVLSQGESRMAKTTALIDWAEVIVVDVSSQAQGLDLGIILGRRLEGRTVILVAEEGAKIPVDLETLLYVRRPKHPQINPGDFLNTISAAFRRLSEMLRPILEKEPRRLYEKKEYRAAVVAAVSLFEAELRRRVKRDEPQAARMSLWVLVKFALTKQYIDESLTPIIRGWIDVRNRVVHLGQNINPKTTLTIVDGVEQVLFRSRDRQ